VFGGAEVQAYLLATELARRPAYDVSFVVYDHGQPRTQKFEGVTLTSYQGSFQLARELLSTLGSGRGVEGQKAKATSKIEETVINGSAEVQAEGSGKAEIKSPDGVRNRPKIQVKKGRGRIVRLKKHPLTLPLYHVIMVGQFVVDSFRFTLPIIIERTTWLWRTRTADNEFAKYIFNAYRYRTYKEVNADVYIGFGANDLTAEQVSFCRIHDKKSVLWSISDADFNDTYFHGSNIRNYYGDVGDRCHFALMRAHFWITQNNHQREMAKAMFLRDSVIIPNPIDLAIQPHPGRARDKRGYALWIGKADATKQPQHFVALAKAFSGLEFFMVLNPSRTAVEEKIYEHHPGNLRIVDSVHRDEVPALMEGAFVLVNSSKFEGMPNVFLEACRAGTPLLSLNADPNGFIGGEGCGIWADGDLSAFRQGFERLVNDQAFWERCSTGAIAYVRANHDKAKCVNSLIQVINSVLQDDEDELIDIELGGVRDNFELSGR
jgi:glycosyltransferase involved in cell wall biosynthesis